MRPEDEEYLSGRSERIKLGSRFVMVRELSSAAELPQLNGDADAGYRLLVRSVFEETGEPTFRDEDIPKLKTSSRRRMAKLLTVAARVNGQLLEDEEKNSGAVPSDG